MFFATSFLTLTGVYSQNIQRGQLVDKDSKAGIIAAYIEVYKDTVLIGSTMTDQAGFFTLSNISPGTFDLHVLQIGMRTLKLSQIQLPVDTVLIIAYPPPCIYKTEKPNRCVDGHTDKIIPIIYGLPSKQTLGKARKGKIYLGGCIVSNCDPNFYCTIHKREL